ncbi:uncharacterized protein LOC101242330 isoform X2 [Ciona intestinalis]
MKISTIASILVYVCFITNIEGYLRPVYFGNDACQISNNHRIRCGTQYMSRHICEAMGCCYQYTIYGSWCYYSKLSYTFFPPSQGSNRVNSLPSTIRTTRATTTPTTPTTTTTPPTTTVQTTTPISAAVSNQNEVRKQSKPNADLLELLSRLAAMHRAAQSKEEAPTRPRAQSVNTTEPIEAHASGVVSSNPVSRGAMAQNGSESSTCLFNPEERDDCGFPGITKVRCESMGCCWNSTLDGVYWCFFSVLVSEELVPPPLVNTTSLDLDADSPSWRNNLNMDYSEEELIEPPLPPNIDDDDSFLALVAQEISGEEPPDVEMVEDNNLTVPTYNSTINVYNNTTNASVSPLIVFPAILSVLNTTTRTLVRTETPTTQSTTQTSTTLSEPPWLQQLLSNHEPTATTTTTVPVTTTTATTTTITKVLPPYTDPIVHAVSPQVNTQPAPTAGLNEIAALLKILQGMERQTAQQVSHECTVDAQDECCRNDPTAPCCEYQTHRDLAHRAAPMARIVGGGPAGLLRFSVAYLSKNSLSTQFCGGTWIDNQWVLTAAHCVLDYCSRARPVSELMVSLGKYRKLSFQRDVGQLDLRVIDVICHPTNCKTAGQPRLNDLALLRLERAVQSNSHYTPAPMPLSFEAPAPQGNCIVLGWGSTQGTGHDNVLKEVSVPLITNEQCNRRDWRNCVIRACMMCAGELSNDPCDGDSGGPLFCQRPNGLYVLHGIYSWGRCGAEERKPAVYTRASYFIDWINRVTNTFGGR